MAAMVLTGCNIDDGDTGPMASLYILVDDTANGTYADGQLLWKATFSYNSTTNVVMYSDSWAGPYVPLYDDGPRSTGGHEAEGQTAGDHILSAEVSISSSSDTTISYGITDDQNTWLWSLWSATNGSVSITAGQTDRVEAPGMAFPAFGTIDVKVTVDTSLVDSDFQPVSFCGIRSSATWWTQVAMVDDGTAGDDSASDGIYTFLLSEHLGPHDGLLNPATEMGFIIVLEGVDYFKDGNAMSTGVAAACDTGSGFDPVSITEGVSDLSITTP